MVSQQPRERLSRGDVQQQGIGGGSPGPRRLILQQNLAIWLLIFGWQGISELSYALSSPVVEPGASATATHVGVSHERDAGQLLWAAQSADPGEDGAAVSALPMAEPWFLNGLGSIGVRYDMGLSIALQYQQQSYEDAATVPEEWLQPRFEPALRVSVARQDQEIIVIGDDLDNRVKMVGGISPDGVPVLLRLQPNDEIDGQGAPPAVWFEGLVSYLRAQGVIDFAPRDAWMRDVRFVADPVHGRPYVSVEFSLSDGLQVVGFNVCIYELPDEQPMTVSEASWKVGLQFKPWLYQDGLRWLATLRPLNRWPYETIWWFVASPGVQPTWDETSLTTVAALQQYYADVMLGNVGAALASWNLYRREGSAHVAAELSHSSPSYPKQIHTLIGWMDHSVRLGDYGYSYVLMPRDTRRQRRPAHTSWSYQPSSGRIDSAMIAMEPPQLNDYLSTELLHMSPQAARDELTGLQPWQAHLARHRAKVYHEVGHAMGAEDNLKGSMVPHDQAVISGMDELHPVVAEILFAHGVLEQPLNYDQVFVDMAYHGMPAAELGVYPRCAQDLWPAAAVVTDVAGSAQTALAVWEQLQGAMDPFCQRGDLFYSLSDGVDLLSRLFSEEVKLAGKPMPPVLSSFDRYFASQADAASVDEDQGEFWVHLEMHQHYNQMIRAYMVDVSPSYADLIYTTMYWLLLWPRYGALYDAEREDNVLARYMRVAPYHALFGEHGVAGLNWLTQADDLLVKSGLNRFGIPLQYALFYTQQRTLLFGLYKDVIRALAGAVDGFEVLPTPIYLAEQTCEFAEIQWMFGDDADCLEMLTQQGRGVMVELAPSLGEGYVARLSQLVQLAQYLPQQSQQVYPALLGLNVLRKLITELMALYDFETIVLDKEHWFSNDAASRVAMELFYVVVAAGIQVQTEIPGVDNEWIRYKDEMLRRLYIKQAELVAQLSTDDDSALVILDDRRGQWERLDLELQYLEAWRDKLQSIGMAE